MVRVAASEASDVPPSVSVALCGSIEEALLREHAALSERRRGPTARDSVASLSSALAVLADAAQRHARHPGRLVAVIDRIKFRIRDVEDLFAFLPCHGPLPPGGGTIWGLICTADPVAAGVLIRQLFVERLGQEFDLAAWNKETILFSLDEYPQNVAIFEVLSRCPSLRDSFCQREGSLTSILESLRALRELIFQAPSARIQTDRTCVGTTSGVYGIRDSDVFYVEADLFRAILEVLLSKEFRSAPDLQASERAAGMRHLCLVIADLSSQLPEYPRVQARAIAFLSSSMPVAFMEDKVQSNSDFWTLVHMLLTSESFAFLEDVLRRCGTSRMHDAQDLRTVHSHIFGASTSKEEYRFGDKKEILADPRLVLSHTMLLSFNILVLMKNRAGQPDRFVDLVMTLLRSRLVPPLRKALDGPVASRWKPIREALGALVAAAEEAPITQFEWLQGARKVFREFAENKFLGTVGVRGALSTSLREELLDPFSGEAVVFTPVSRDQIRVAVPPFPADDTTEHAPEPAKGTPRQALAPAATLEDDRASDPLGLSPRRTEMRFMKMTEATTPLSPSLQPAACEKAPLKSAGGAIFRSTGRSALMRSTRPPASHGCFYNTNTMQFVS
mmetsp:Transcript_94746/g.182026  ORF Transcript_94746/g.182026 Transcript_94746/m.182026 type:complete len:617 (+) Transcript_94746:76-1926(+)